MNERQKKGHDDTDKAKNKVEFTRKISKVNEIPAKNKNYEAIG